MANKDIAKMYGISFATVESINNGAYCYNNNNEYYKNIYNGSFPIRKHKHEKICCDFNLAFYEALFTNKSVTQIEKDLGVTFNGLRYIFLGKRRKELTKDYLLPLRKHIEYNREVWKKLNNMENEL